MLPVIPVIALGALVTAGVVWRRRRDRADAEAPRDDMLRAGSTPEQSPEAAYRRAQGKSSWMRPSF
jgi:hypothetical protein